MEAQSRSGIHGCSDLVIFIDIVTLFWYMKQKLR